MPSEDWDQEKEVDPVKLQQEQLALGKKFMERIEREDREKAERAKEYTVAGITPYKMPPPPTFEERSAVIVKAWTETKRIVPDAPDHVKTLVFQSLLHSASNGSDGNSFIGGLA